RGTGAVRAPAAGRRVPAAGWRGQWWLSSQVLGLEIAQHGHDATVLAVDRGKIELGEQGGDVLLHTPGGDEQGVGDRLVRARSRAVMVSTVRRRRQRTQICWTSSGSSQVPPAPTCATTDRKSSTSATRSLST